MAIAILGVILGVVLQLQLIAAAQRRVAEQRQLAGWEVANVIERLKAEPYERLQQELAASMKLSPRANELLRDAQLTVEIAEVAPSAEATSPDIPSKRIHARLTWLDRHGKRPAPVELVAWAFPHAADEPPEPREVAP
ncbi:MAG: hypothetical protein JNG90_06130 [Planctomycetaceae bacterium]|nr:hypothetical protein [Planctomycetaceae bacterium]